MILWFRKYGNLFFKFLEVFHIKWSCFSIFCIDWHVKWNPDPFSFLYLKELSKRVGYEESPNFALLRTRDKKLVAFGSFNFDNLSAHMAQCQCLVCKRLMSIWANFTSTFFLARTQIAIDPLPPGTKLGQLSTKGPNLTKHSLKMPMTVS